MEDDPNRQALNAKVDETVTQPLLVIIFIQIQHMLILMKKLCDMEFFESKQIEISIWITSKLDLHEFDDAKNGIDGILERLQTDYLDLLFLHHPVGNITTIVSAYRAMEEAYKAGKFRALGISNFDNFMEAYNVIMKEDFKPQLM